MINLRNHRAVVARTILGFCLATSLYAQTNAGSITGLVNDQQQAVMAGVRITATSLATKVSQTAVTSSAGVYTLPALEPGQYRLIAEFPGFKKLVREPISVAAQHAVTIDLQMSVGDTTTEVTVTAEAPMIQQANATVQYGVNQKAIDELPFADQNVLSVLSTVPGVVGEPGSEQPSVYTGYVAPGAGVSVSGGRPGSTQYQADGVSNNSTFFNRISVSFSADAVQEVSVLVNNYSAEYGKVGGGIVNMSTKSGANKLHGTVFSFSQNDVLNAAPYASATNKKGKVRYWRGGVDVGGPVYIPKLYNGKNRTFFFFSYEPNRNYSQVAYYVRTATELERQGDFSQSYISSSYCATCKRIPVFIFQQFLANQSGTGLTNTPITLSAGAAYPWFEGNRIPKSMISAAGQKILNLLPLPNMEYNQVGQNYFFWRNVRNTDNRYTVKLDQVLTSASRLSFRISQVPIVGDRAFGNPTIAQVPIDRNTGTNAAFNHTYVWGGNKVNELRLGYNRGNMYRGQNDTQRSKNWYQEFGIPSFLDRGFPNIAIGDSFFNFGGSPFGQYEIDNFFQATDIVNWTRGRHSIKVGFEFQAPQQNLVDYGSVAGSWNFYNNMTNIGSANTATYPGLMTANAQTGFGPASLLLGIVNGVTMAPAVVPYQYRWKYYATFLQDDFKITPRLTLNLGVRYQIEAPRSEKNRNQGYWVNETATNSQGIQVPGYVQMLGYGGVRNTLWPTRYNNIEPRLGFAYRTPSWIKGLTTIRGGYAITHVPTNGLFRIAIPDLGPKSQQLATTGSAGGGRVMLDGYPLALPKATYVIPSDGKFVDFQNINAVYYLNQNVKIPYVQQWNLGLGFQFGRNYGLSITYVGSKGTSLFGPSQLYNTIDKGEYARQLVAGVNMSEVIPNPQGLRDQNGNIIRVTRQNSLRPNPTLGTIGNPLEQGYNSSYNSIQTQLTKRYSQGLQFNVNYTFGKSIDNSSCEGQFCNDAVHLWGTGAPQLFSGDRRLERSISIYNIPQSFKFSYNWDLPFGRGKHWMSSSRGVVNQVIGNWKISGLSTIQMGLPYQIRLGSTAGWPEDVGQLRPNLVPGAQIVNEGWRQNLNNPTNPNAAYLNAYAFAPPARLTIGQLPRVTNIYSPNTFKFDMSIQKEFPIREQVKAVFRAELYGALNHPSVQANSNNFQVFQNLDYAHYETPPVGPSNIVSAFSNVTLNIMGTRTIQLGMKLYF
jgi:hypothetical protein